VVLVCIAGLAAVLINLHPWPAAEFGVRFWIYLALGLVGGALKVRIPGLLGTFSLTFFVFLMAVADVGWLEASIVLIASQTVQTIWFAIDGIFLKRILFNAAAVMIPLTLSYAVDDRIHAGGPHVNPLLRILAAGAIYFISNTAIVGGINALESSRPYFAVLMSWWRWCLAYYLIGVGLALLVELINLYFGWGIGFLLTPLLFQEHIFFKANADARRPASP